MYRFTTLAVQSWALYAISISLVFSRFIFRRITLGSCKKLQADDWLMMVVLLPYTASIVLANQVGTSHSAEERKFRYVLEEMQIITIWLVKACLLVLYWRIFPVETSFTKRRILQCVSGFCCLSFLVVQVSLMLWCTPTEAHWAISTSNTQCTSYQAHTALTLAFTTPTILLTMILPVPFIPTPRRLLLAILLILSTLVLITSIVARASISQHPTRPNYLAWYTTESTLSIIFANLPFLTSLVVTAAPARIRHFSSQLALNQWPRSRRGSWAYADETARSSPRTTRFDSNATTIFELTAPNSPEKARKHAGGERDVRLDADGASKSVVVTSGEVSHVDDSNLGNSATSPSSSSREADYSLPSPSAIRPETRDSQVPKTRLSGGLAEMGELSLQDTTQGWPIYWK